VPFHYTVGQAIFWADLGLKIELCTKIDNQYNEVLSHMQKLSVSEFRASEF
jgi:hypothetical protein